VFDFLFVCGARMDLQGDLPERQITITITIDVIFVLCSIQHYDDLSWVFVLPFSQRSPKKNHSKRSSCLRFVVPRDIQRVLKQTILKSTREFGILQELLERCLPVVLKCGGVEFPQVCCHTTNLTSPSLAVHWRCYTFRRNTLRN